jgi:hypothetical protein
MVFSFGLGGFRSASIKRLRASAVKVSGRPVFSLFPCLSRFVMINVNSLSFEWGGIVSGSVQTPVVENPDFIADRSRTADFLTASRRPLRVRVNFARNDSCYFTERAGRPPVQVTSRRCAASSCIIRYNLSGIVDRHLIGGDGMKPATF